ncbi:uncharacterized protein BCR38DRAFT_450308 [Pseudomassariella vexata]|uniref:NmrA-like domain-containing protein n=1 Tax=Pseudomassariella vexata TaxID=1141098 RepID=A0A1Y2DC93_9PEZI|nr:uncharacterized protein BCR38DRAFT_450308 [Pseudomassariella vexata]ORY56892.1 hypothetical protein BCR38DRAFT_450308 [Pseudomassariella vexata]
MLSIIGASGNLGGATLSALLSHNLLPPQSIIAITSSNPNSDTWGSLAAKGVEVRHGDFDDPSSLESALRGSTKLFLVSTPRIALDFHDAPEGEGREKHHKVAIDAARKVGVKHIYYSSLAFGNPSKAGVMRAHVRTERYLKGLGEDDVKVTVLREGLYNESWPLYMGYYDPKEDERGSVRLAGDGKVCWTGIEDLGVGNALVLVAPGEEWEGQTVYLSTPPEMAKTMAEIASMVAKGRGREVSVEVVGRKDYETYYINEKKMDPGAVEWWSSTYDALEDGECLIDDHTLVKLLATRGKKPVPVEETVAAMVTEG